jgi:hypothetical protein
VPLGSAKGKLEDKYGKQPIENAGAAVLMLGKQTMRASAEGVRVAEKNPKSELARLRKKQRQAQQDEVYGGFSESERAEYDSRAERINELGAQLHTVTSTDEAAAQQRHEWNKKWGTDTPQSEDRQPYRTREQDSTNPSTDSLETVQTKKKPNPEGNRE